MRLAFLSPALTLLALTSAAAQAPDQLRNNASPRNPGVAAPGANDGAAPRLANSADRAFLVAASASGLAEIELARLAEQKASSNSVREFARQMLQDHDQANRSLRSLAESQGAAAPDEIDAEDREIRDALRRLNGAEFDIEYLRLQRQAQQRMIQLQEYEIGSGADPQVQRLASDTLPRSFTDLVTVRQLLDQASTQNPRIAALPPRKASGLPTPQTPRASLK